MKSKTVDVGISTIISGIKTTNMLQLLSCWVEITILELEGPKKEALNPGPY